MNTALFISALSAISLAIAIKSYFTYKSVSAIASILSAIATIIISFFTFLSVKSSQENIEISKKSIKIQEKDQKYNVRPIVFIDFNNEKTGIEKIGIKENNGKYFIETTFYNKGNGPAFNIHIYLINYRGYIMTKPIFISNFLYQNNHLEYEKEIKDNDMSCYIYGDNNIKYYDLNQNINDTYYVAIEYEDIFKNIYSTIYKKGNDKHNKDNEEMYNAKSKEEKERILIKQLEGIKSITSPEIIEGEIEKKYLFQQTNEQYVPDAKTNNALLF